MSKGEWLAVEIVTAVLLVIVFHHLREKKRA